MTKAIILCFGILILTTILSIFEQYTNKKKKKEQNYIDYLPGKNCGECGFNNCLGMIKSMEENKNNYLKCKHLNVNNKEILKNMTKES